MNLPLLSCGLRQLTQFHSPAVIERRSSAQRKPFAMAADVKCQALHVATSAKTQSFAFRPHIPSNWLSVLRSCSAHQGVLRLSKLPFGAVLFCVCQKRAGTKYQLLLFPFMLQVALRLYRLTIPAHH